MLPFDIVKDLLKREAADAGRGEKRPQYNLSLQSSEQKKSVKIKIYIGQDPETGEYRMMTD